METVAWRLLLSGPVGPVLVVIGQPSQLPHQDTSFTGHGLVGKNEPEIPDAVC